MARKTRKARTPGRPSAGGVDVRERLIEAALRCFVREGIAGTSLRAISREAGTTPAMLHYYFGDKAQLIEALTAERFLPALAALREPLSHDAEDIRGLVRDFVRAMMRTIEANPWLPPLWVREVLAEGGALRELLVGTVGPQLPRVLAERFAKARRRGELPRDIDPGLLVTSLIGLTMFPAAGMPVWGRLFPERSVDARAIERHAVAMLMHGIALEEAQ